ncbi:sedoheptulokinase-like [Saccoglossus kowalevskii]|uniref:Sedoheptulokinase-like n=1 Tax=Saccoglossus kowalevskii TaxID=10224 RepID=A0ABM0GRW4_SACKO|nr:PREDICTED: sedoheptulokinase-like [Saccoglossus kowalevskii]
MAVNGVHTSPSYILGIDLGTTSVKAALIDRDTKEVVSSVSRETCAGVCSDLGILGNEQDPSKIIRACSMCVSGLPKHSLIKVSSIGVSGQMHGCLLWKSGEGWARRGTGRLDVGKCSQLITWQDQRCTSDFLRSLPAPKSHLRLSTGHGCATLFWMKRNKPDLLDSYDCAGTIQDFLVAMLCGLEKPVMSVQNAASWGYYDTVNKVWNSGILSEAGFPVKLLPEVKTPGSNAGNLEYNWYGIPQGVPVGIALGDMQCSILPSLQSETDAVLNISTSAQLSFAMSKKFIPPLTSESGTAVEYFPYFHDCYLAVAAALTGGNVLATMVKMLQQWTHELGHGIPQQDIYNKILSAAQEINDCDLVVSPTIFGERHIPNQRASVMNITAENLTLGHLGRAVCRGIITNLYEMMPRELLVESGVQQIIGCGSALTRNKILQTEIENLWKLPVVYCQGGDAAVGAALSQTIEYNV